MRLWAGLLYALALALLPAGCTGTKPTAKPSAAHSAAAALRPAPIDHSGMVFVPPTTFHMGSTYAQFTDATPVHTVRLDGFWIDATLVTNAQFEKFVAATGYVTVAEQKLDPQQFPGVPADKLVPGALVFTPPKHSVALDDVSQWWSYVPGLLFGC